MNKQGKNDFIVTIIIIAIIVLAGMYIQKSYQLFSISGSETMTRTASSTSVTPGSSFTLTYTAIGTSGKWGSSIVDSVVGGCTFPSGSNTYNSVLSSSTGLTKQITMQTPASAGTCTFTGDYKYGDNPTRAFSSLTISVSCVKFDTNCNNIIEDSEMLEAINKWITGQATRDELGKAFQSWSSS